MTGNVAFITTNKITEVEDCDPCVGGILIAAEVNQCCRQCITITSPYTTLTITATTLGNYKALKLNKPVYINIIHITFYTIWHLHF